MKGVRQKLFETFPGLRALDGYRKNFGVLDPGNINIDDDKPEYTCDEEWFSPDIYLTTVGKDLFQKTTQSSKEEIEFKNLIKDCDSFLTRKTNLLTL
ncbi:hypothetical protein FGO68_gene7340 [Halteria grandinella]|uniref:Uncharacterized protein n=1 Tax=Halteria grandinella TaxID=5974 RepID=A0A8J8NXL0_HALGN|nr:hypothetical protein FGO68_gene7340 [Halteria grandinella]